MPDNRPFETVASKSPLAYQDERGMPRLLDPSDFDFIPAQRAQKSKILARIMLMFGKGGG